MNYFFHAYFKVPLSGRIKFGQPLEICTLNVRSLLNGAL